MRNEDLTPEEFQRRWKDRKRAARVNPTASEPDASAADWEAYETWLRDRMDRDREIATEIDCEKRISAQRERDWKLEAERLRHEAAIARQAREADGARRVLLVVSCLVLLGALIIAIFLGAVR